MLFKSAADLLPLLTPGQRVLGLDVGEKTIGVALSDRLCGIASPLVTLMRKTFKSDFPILRGLVSEHAAVALIIGYPINMNGTEGPRCQSVRQFSRNIQERLPIPILLWDERMSTMAVTRAIDEAEMSRNRRDAVVDKMAASYLLQTFLDFAAMKKGAITP